MPAHINTKSITVTKPNASEH